MSWGQLPSGLFTALLIVCSCQSCWVFLFRDVWRTKRQTLGNNSTGFHSALVILQEFISVHGCSIVLIIALVSYGYIWDYHKFSGLKQHKWISLGWHRGVSRAVFLSGKILGDNQFPYLLHLLEAACIAWFMPPSNFKTNNGRVSLSHILSLWHSSVPFLHLRTLWSHWTHQNKPGSFPSVKTSCLATWIPSADLPPTTFAL